MITKYYHIYTYINLENGEMVENVSKIKEISEKEIIKHKKETSHGKDQYGRFTTIKHTIEWRPKYKQISLFD